MFEADTFKYYLFFTIYINGKKSRIFCRSF